MAMKIPHKYDRRGSLDSGNRAEKLFDKIAISMGFNVMRATLEQDMVEKWDRLLYKGLKTSGGMYRVEIKGLKRVKWSERLQDTWTWIELHGVNEEDDGWLYGGKSDIVAFQRSNKFLLVERSKLIDLVNILVDFGKTVDKPENAEYKIYNRDTRPYEKTTMIELSKIEEIKFREWDIPTEDNNAGW